MRKGGKGETSYILIIPVVFSWWGRGECVCWGLRNRVGWLPCKAQLSYRGPSSAVLPGVDTFPFNYSATRCRIDSPGGSWVNLGLNTHLCPHSYTHTNWLCLNIKSKIISTVIVKGWTMLLLDLMNTAIICKLQEEVVYVCSLFIHIFNFLYWSFL